MPLDPTPGGASANSYCSLAEANDYSSTRLFVDAWNAADDPTKTAALIEAARLLDSSFEWTGRASTPTQAMGWPRIGMASRNKFPIDPSVIPQPLKDAQSEFARQLIVADRTADNGAVKSELLQVGAGSARVNFRDTEAGSTVEMKDAAVRRKGPDLDYLAKWIPDAVRNLLVKTWYVQSLVSNPLIFNAIGGPDHGHDR